MNSLEILRLVKRKLFEPKKKIIYNANGDKLIVEKKLGDSTMSLNILDKEILQENDGWNLADRDYVDQKISEINKQMLHVTNLSANIPPSAPKLDLFDNKKTSCKYVFLSKGIEGPDGNILFFNPGLIVKKNTILLECYFITDLPVETLEFSIFSSLDNKLVFSSKIKQIEENVFNSKINLKTDSLKNLIIKVKGCSKPLNINLQFVVLE